MKLQTVIILLYCYTVSVSSLYCYWNTGCSYKYFASRTPYHSVRGDIRDTLIKIKQCEPVSLWSIVRHGAVNPGVEFGSKMQKAIYFKDLIVQSHKNKNSSLCSQDVDNLSDWVDKNNIFSNNQLTEQGYQDMLHLGKRMVQAFPKLLKNLNGDSYLFKSGKDAWTKNSLMAYVEGLNGKLRDATDYDILDKYITCEKFIEKVKINPDTYKEYETYVEGLEFLSAKDRIQRRTGLSYDLSDDNVTSLYDLCRYTRIGANNFSPWCSLFTSDDLKVMEYSEDLRHYYRNGHGNPLAKTFAGPVLRDLLANLQQAKSGTGKNIVSYVSHGTMTNMIYAALGLFKDVTPLKGSKRDNERKWRTSFLRSFSSNLLAVLSRCKEGTVENFNVIFYLNEQPLQSICGDGICSWEEFENLLEPFINATVTDDDCKIK